MDHKILVGTFHETGSDLIRRIMREVAEALDLRLWRIDGKDAQEPGHWDIAVHGRSRFAEALLERHPHRGVLVIRDPRDVVVSATHYHMVSREKWLHEPRAKWQGMTYQQRINSFRHQQRRLIFDLNNASGRLVRDMLEATASHPGFRVVRLEALTADRDLAPFRDMFSHLGLPAERMDELLGIARKNCQLAGIAVPGRVARPDRWQRAFTPQVLETFMAKFPDAPEALGYEPSSLDRLERDAPFHPATSAA